MMTLVEGCQRLRPDAPWEDTIVAGGILFTENERLGKGVEDRRPIHDEILAYLKEKLGLAVCDVKEALALLEHPSRR